MWTVGHVCLTIWPKGINYMAQFRAHINTGRGSEVSRLGQRNELLKVSLDTYNIGVEVTATGNILRTGDKAVEEVITVRRTAGNGGRLGTKTLLTVTVMKTGKVIISHLLSNGGIYEEVIL